MGGNCAKQFSANTLVEELHMKWRCGMMALANSSSRAAGRDLWKTMTFDYHVGTSKFDVRIYDCTQCQKEFEAEA
jgi:hypothetical protein